MRMSSAPSSRVPDGIEVVRDGRVIFAYGFSGPGAVLECIEQLGNAMRGAIVRVKTLDGISAKLLVRARVLEVEAGRADRRALQVLDGAGIQARGRTIVDDPAGGPLAELEGLEDPEEVYERLIGSPRLRCLAWSE